MKLIGLMRRYGFLYDPVTRTLRSKGIPGFTSSGPCGGRYQSALDAAEYLIGIIREDHYYDDTYDRSGAVVLPPSWTHIRLLDDIFYRTRKCSYRPIAANNTTPQKIVPYAPAFETHPRPTWSSIFTGSEVVFLSEKL